MKSIWFIGVDVSKVTLDIAVCHRNRPDQFVHQQFANNTSGFKQLLVWLKKQKVDINRGFFCMEHTARLPLVTIHWPFAAFFKSRNYLIR
jgi:transposase